MGVKVKGDATVKEILEAIEVNFLKLIIICTNEEMEKHVVNASMKTMTKTSQDTIRGDKKEKMTEIMKDTIKNHRVESMTYILKDIVLSDTKKEVA